MKVIVAVCVVGLVGVFVLAHASASRDRDKGVPQAGQRPAIGTTGERSGTSTSTSTNSAASTSTQTEASTTAPGQVALTAFAASRKALPSAEDRQTREDALADSGALRVAAERLASGSFDDLLTLAWSDADLGVPAGYLAAAPAKKADLLRLLHVDYLADALAWRANPAYEDSWHLTATLVASPNAVIGDRLELLAALQAADPARTAALLASLEDGEGRKRLLALSSRFAGTAGAVR